jgi:hypothetical protein
MAFFYGRKWFIKQELQVSPNYTPQLLIQAEAGSFEATYQQRGVKVIINGTQVLSSSAPRSYRVTQLRPSGNSWSYIGSTGYDVYGSVTAAQNMNTALQGFQTGDMLIMNTWDEPRNNSSYIQSTLINDFGSKMDTFVREFRDMHLLISVKGAKAPIYEEHRARYSNAIWFSGWL